MIFIKPEEKEEFTSSFFFKLHYLEIQMWILTEKFLKLCFFLLVVFFLSVLVTIV